MKKQITKKPETTLAGIGFMASVFGELMLNASGVKTEFKANDHKILELAKKPQPEIEKALKEKLIDLKPTNLQIVEKAIIDLKYILNDLYKIDLKGVDNLEQLSSSINYVHTSVSQLNKLKNSLKK